MEFTVWLEAPAEDGETVPGAIAHWDWCAAALTEDEVDLSPVEGKAPLHLLRATSQGARALGREELCVRDFRHARKGVPHLLQSRQRSVPTTASRRPSVHRRLSRSSEARR
jgi:hypothetical protein